MKLALIALFAALALTNGCSLTDGSTKYDLSRLIKADGDYEIKAGTATYALNICKKLSSFKDFESDNAASARTDDKYKYNLGKVSENLEVKEGGDLVLVYTGGDKCNIGSGTRSTVIHFICNKNAGTGSPKYIYDNECTYLFSWTTAEACPSNLNSTSGGSAIMIILVVVIVAYFLGMALYKRAQGAVGLEQIPHIDFFRSVLAKLRGIRLPVGGGSGEGYNRVRVGDNIEQGMLSEDDEI